MSSAGIASLWRQPSADTDAWRILHDASAGVWIDHFAGRWLVQTREESYPERVTDLAGDTASSIYWKPRSVDASTQPEHRWGQTVSEPFTVSENGVRYRIDFGAGYSPGIFLDQRLNRKRIAGMISKGDRILNTFAYTGAFSVVAARSGAITSTLDLSKNYLDWTWKNFALNGIDKNDHFGCRGDTFEWLNVFAKKARQFEGVILDPPTFSRHGRKTFRTDRNYADLACLAARVVAPGGWLLCCANTHRLGKDDFIRQVNRGVRRANRQILQRESWPMPPEFRGDDYLKSLWVVVG